MPGGDGTGPVGMGAMTGHGAGYCGGSPVPGCMNTVPERGFGRGGGRGRGWRHRHFAAGVPGRQRAGRRAASPRAGRGRGVSDATALESSTESRDQEIALLKQQAEGLKKTLGDIASRIDQLEAEPPAQKE